MSTWFAITLVAMFIVAFVVLAYWRQWHWTGLPAAPATSTGAEDRPSKTLWDWLQLLGIPVALASLAFLLNNAESVRDQRHAEDAERENTLRTYLAQMSNLVLDRKLLRSKAGADVRNVARTATLTAVRRLDGPRRGLVVQFLAEARLLRREKDEDARALVASGDFTDAHLAGANLSGANLRGANLTDAKLRRGVPRRCGTRRGEPTRGRPPGGGPRRCGARRCGLERGEPPRGGPRRCGLERGEPPRGDPHQGQPPQGDPLGRPPRGEPH